MNRSPDKLSLSAALSQNHYIAILLLLFVALLPLMSALDKNPNYLPLVGKDGWTITGVVPLFDRAPATDQEIPHQIRNSADAVFRRSWTPQTGGTIGSVTTSEFQLPTYLAIPYQGFPRETPEDRIYLKIEGGDELEVATIATLNMWATVYLEVPKRYIGKKARLIANAASNKQYIAVGTPFSVPQSVYIANTALAPRLLIIFFTWSVLSIVGLIAADFATRGKISKDPVPWSLIGIGVFGVASFCLINLSGGFFPAAMAFLFTAVLARIWWIYRTEPSHLFRLLDVLAKPALVWLAVSILYSVLTTTIDNGGGSWAVNGMFSPARWSSDNQLPFWFAEGLYNATKPQEIVWGPWLASDRTPLLTDLLLIPRATVLACLAPYLGSTFVPIGYMAAGITILSLWAAVLTWLAKKAGCRNLAIFLLVTLTSPFVMFNTVYTWPKILGATYAVLAFSAAFYSDDEPRWLHLVAISACFAFLSHASNAFALVPILFAFLPAIFGAGIGTIAFASLCAVALASPWFIWQHLYQPNGDVLLRYALTGDFGFESRGQGMLPDVLKTYRTLGFDGWMTAKISSIKLLLGIDNSAISFPEMALSQSDTLGRQRVLDFFVLSRALGISMFGILLIWASSISRIAAAAATVGFFGIVITTLTTLSQPIVHQLPYGSILLLIFAGAFAVANSNRFALISICAIGLLYYSIVWVADPMSRALRLNFDYSTLTATMASIAILLSVLRSQQQTKKTTPEVLDRSSKQETEQGTNSD